MPLNPDAETLLRLTAERTVSSIKLTPEIARKQQRDRTTWATGASETVAKVYDMKVPGLTNPIGVRVYVPRITVAKLPMLAFFHGGGWVTCDLDSHDALCRAICNRADCIVVSVDYPLAPECPFPAGLDACWAVTTWLSQHGAEIGGDVARLAVGGDSAGGNLAAVVALRAKKAGVPLVLQLLLYPITDYRLDSPADDRIGETYGLNVEVLRFYYQNYVPSTIDVHDPEVSPFREVDLTDVAPAYLITCEFDPLLPEAEDYAIRLIRAGVPVSSLRYYGQIHGFVRATGLVEQSWFAIEHIAHALRGAFWLPPPLASHSDNLPRFTDDGTPAPLGPLAL